jgi:hypothetical protein
MNTYVFYVTINNSALKHKGIVRADSRDLLEIRALKMSVLSG